MMVESDDLKMLKRALTDYAETSVRMGIQTEDCLLWGFATVLAIQSNEELDFTGHTYPPEALINLTLKFLEDLEQRGFNTRVLKQLQPPKLTPHTLFHLAYAAANRHFTKEELNHTLDWVIEQFRLNMQAGITPREVASVMVSLLELKDGSKVLDPAMGSGAFLQAVQTGGEVLIDFIGIEKNENIAFIASLYAFINDYKKTDIRLGGAFYHLQNEKQHYDYVISNPPVYRIPKPMAEHQFREVIENQQISSEMSLNLVQLGLHSLKANGKAAFLVHMGTLFSATEVRIRQEWVHQGWIEAVISLPNKLLPHTSNKCAILLFNKAAINNSIAFVKADDLFKPMANGQNRLVENAFEEIKTRLDSIKTTFANSLVTAESIIKENYSLYPDHYVLKDIDQVAEKISKQWTRLGEMASVIQGTRGFKKLPDGDDVFIAGKTIRQLKEAMPLLEKKDSSVVVEKLIKTEAYDILIQRIGEVPAIHMVLPEQENIIVIDTVFILRFHDKKPSFIHFIAEFLSSERGANHIASYCHNVTAQTLTKTILQKITVPIADELMQSLMMEIAQAENQLAQETLNANALKNQVFEGLGYDKVEDDFDRIRFSLNTLDTALKNKDKISYKVGNQYPYPLAYAYRNLYADREWSATYENQMKFGELILSFMVSVGLGLLNHHKNNAEIDQTTILKELAKALQIGISPGHWKNFLHLICIELRKVPTCPMSNQLSASWFKGRGNKVSDFGRETISDLISKLNDKKHWRGPKGSHASKEAVAGHQENIDKALLDIEFISGWDFFINDKLDYLNDLSTFACSITLLRGDHPCFEQTEIKSNMPLPVGDIYCSYEGSIVNLSPFLVSLFNSKTQRTEIFSLDKKSKNGNYMLKSFDSGQSIETQGGLREKFDLMLEI